MLTAATDGTACRRCVRVSVCRAEHPNTRSGRLCCSRLLLVTCEAGLPARASHEHIQRVGTEAQQQRCQCRTGGDK